MTDRIRTTISIDAEALETFKSMADAMGVSVSRCMGDWLAETAEGAKFVAMRMVEAKLAPRAVMREFHQVASKWVGEAAANPQAFQESAADYEASLSRPGRGRGAQASGPAHSDPPSSPTGVKDLPKRRKAR